MMKAEWQCMDELQMYQNVVDYWDSLSYVECLSEQELRQWERAMEKVTYFVNLKDGIYKIIPTCYI